MTNILFSVVFVNTRARNGSQSSSMSETDTEINLSVKNPLPVIEEVKETEMMDTVTENFAATTEINNTEDI